MTRLLAALLLVAPVACGTAPQRSAAHRPRAQGNARSADFYAREAIRLERTLD